jgi:hypothetical protein
MNDLHDMYHVLTKRGLQCSKNQYFIYKLLLNNFNKSGLFFTTLFKEARFKIANVIKKIDLKKRPHAFA